MSKRFEISPKMVNIGFKKFEAWHKTKFGLIDNLTARQRFKQLGGVLPPKPKKEGGV